jgi:hypothetical protein
VAEVDEAAGASAMRVAVLATKEAPPTVTLKVDIMIKDDKFEKTL